VCLDFNSSCYSQRNTGRQLTYTAVEQVKFKAAVKFSSQSVRLTSVKLKQKYLAIKLSKLPLVPSSELDLQNSQPTFKTQIIKIIIA